MMYMYKQDDFQAKEDSMVFHSHTMALIYVEVLIVLSRVE